MQITAVSFFSYTALCRVRDPEHQHFSVNSVIVSHIDETLSNSTCFHNLNVHITIRWELRLLITVFCHAQSVERSLPFLECSAVCSYILSQAGLPGTCLRFLFIMAVTSVRHSDTSLTDPDITILKQNSRLILVAFITASVTCVWLLTIAKPSIAWLLPLLGVFAKLQKATISFVLSLCLHGTTRLSLDGF